MNVSTGTSAETRYFSPGEWNGVTVWVEELLWREQGPCLVGHELSPMTYYGEETGGLYCPHCCGVAATREETT